MGVQTKKHRKWAHRPDNRERLIAAGYAVLSEKGYEAATVKEISRAADVSPGLFHYYFASKDEFLLAVLEEAGKRYGRRMWELLSSVPAERYLEAALTVAQETVDRDPGWYRLRYELYALGLRKPGFLPAVGEQLAHIRREIAQKWRIATGGDEARARALAAVVLACFDGLALQQLAQPGVDLTAAYDVLSAMIRPDAHQKGPGEKG